MHMHIDFEAIAPSKCDKCGEIVEQVDVVKTIRSTYDEPAEYAEACPECGAIDSLQEVDDDEPTSAAQLRIKELELAEMEAELQITALKAENAKLRKQIEEMTKSHRDARILEREIFSNICGKLRKAVGERDDARAEVLNLWAENRQKNRS